VELKLINDKGAAGTTPAADAIFGREFNEPLVHQIVVAYQANARRGTRKQKERSEIAKSTRKPWRQKGTGRARAGMASSPLWRGGGKIFASSPDENFSHKVNRKMMRAGLASILSQLAREDVPAGRFEQLATQLSNCPSSQEGGDLGWLTPEDCAPELANELFFQTDSRWGMGVHPRLVHTRYGLHIIEVLGRRKGTLPSFEELQDRIRAQLTMQSRSTALRQYMQLLVGEAVIEGIELEGASSPLVQ
jgi:hypothetical protein